MLKNTFRQFDELGIVDVDCELPPATKDADCEDIRETGNIIDVTHTFLFHIKNKETRKQVCDIMHTHERVEDDTIKYIDSTKTVVRFGLDINAFIRMLELFRTLEDEELVNVEIKSNNKIYVIRIEGKDVVMYATTEMVKL